MRMFYRGLCGLLCLFSISSWADNLWLSNGDKLSGKLLGVMDGQLTWESPILGKLKVSQSQVDFIETVSNYQLLVDAEQPLKACAFQRREQQQWVSCEGAEQVLSNLQQLTQVTNGQLVDKRAYQLSGSVAVALNYSSGNTDEQETAIDIRSKYRNNVNRHTVTVDVDIKETDDVQTKEEHTYRYKYDRFISEQWYWTANISYEKDDFKDMETRMSIGAGVGYQVFDTDDLSLAFEGGLSQIVEEFTDGSDDEIGALRLTTDFEWKIMDNGLSFFHRNLFWQTFESGEAWDLETETGLLFPIIGRLSSEFKFEFDYDNEPSDGDQKSDRVWTMGLRYDW